MKNTLKYLTAIGESKCRVDIFTFAMSFLGKTDARAAEQDLTHFADCDGVLGKQFIFNRSRAVHNVNLQCRAPLGVFN